MNHYIIENHIDSCKAAKGEWYTELPFHKIRNCWQVSFIFYANADFHLIQHWACCGYRHHLDTKKTIIENFYTKTLLNQRYYDTAQYRFDQDFKGDIDWNKINKKKLFEVNHIYSDASGREYCMRSKVNYMDKFVNQEYLNENYNTACDWIKNNYKKFKIDMDEALNTVSELKYANSCHMPKESRITYSLSELMKILNQNQFNLLKQKTNAK